MNPIHLLRLIHEYGLNDTTEQELLYFLSLLVSLVAVLVCIAQQFLTASYGRHAHYSHIYKFSMNAKAAWFTQEFPSFLIPVILLSIEFGNTGTVEMTLCSYFLLHYAQR